MKISTIGPVSGYFLLLLAGLLPHLTFAQSPLFEQHWTNSTETGLIGSPAVLLTQSIDTVCQDLKISVTDPVNSPLGAFTPLTINPLDSMGNEITDLSGQLRVYLRVRSLDTVGVAIQLRSGDGTAPFRSDVINKTVLPGLQGWTELEYVFDPSNIAGFDSTNFRDLWFYFDYGTNNIQGNDVRLDYVAIGSPPAASLLSPCFFVAPFSFPYVLNWTSSADDILVGGTAGLLTQSIDLPCEELLISITDPVNAPLAAFAPVTLNPLDNQGNEITDLSGQMRFFVRARSLDTVRIGIQLRSGDGSAPFRSDVVEKTILPGLQSWTLEAFQFDATNLGGFDSTDFRDIFVYFDRGVDNFRGNELHLDFFSIGDEPDPADFSPCFFVAPFSFPYVLNWTSSADDILVGGTAGLLTQSIDLPCEELLISITDPVNAPLAAFAPVTLNPLDNQGNEITDLSGQMRFFVRARSLDTVRIGIQLRSGDGSAPFRSDVVEKTILPGLQSWTLEAFQFDATNLGGFDSTDFRDIFVYFDRGVDNFRGNELHLDFFSIGDEPDPTDFSPCFGLPSFPFPYVVNWTDAAAPVLSGAAALLLNQNIDVPCGELQISVIDTANAPVAPFVPLFLLPTDSLGNALSDLSNQMRFYIRVRSLDTVRLGLQLRSADGSVAFRTDVLEQVVPADLQNWTLLSYTFSTSELGGFDSTDLKDIWLFFDREDPNFRGNEIHLDFFSIGSLPDSSTWSSCVYTPPMPFTFPYVNNWSRSSDPIFTGGPALVLTQTIDTVCQSLQVLVTDTANSPLNPFNPLFLNPLDNQGNELEDLSGQMRFYLRVRSADSVAVSMQLRSGDGSGPFRTEAVERITDANFQSWQVLEFRFDSTDLGGFDSTDLRDVWVYLDRRNVNFPGNDIHLDFFSMGGLPDDSTWSPCFRPIPPFPFLYNWQDTLDGGVAGSPMLTQTIDTLCGELRLAVTDPVNAPLGASTPLVFDPKNNLGEEARDLSHQMRFYLRARSRDTVNVALQLRSGDGSQALRTQRVEHTLPGGEAAWHLLEFRFEGISLSNFDSTDLRDIWLFLDRGTDNFRGNDFRIDFFAIGALPDNSLWSVCADSNFVFPFVANWQDPFDGQFGGVPLNRLDQVIDTSCEEIRVAVHDPQGNPLPAAQALAYYPRDPFGNYYRDLTGQTRLYLRVRSEGSFNLDARLQDHNNQVTQPIRQIVPADPSGWTVLSFLWDATAFGNFDPANFRNVSLTLDPAADNFPGNEFHLDYLSLGAQADDTTLAECFRTDLGEARPVDWRVYPNPIARGEVLRIQLQAPSLQPTTVSLWNAMGQRLAIGPISINPDEITFRLPVEWTPGLYWIRLEQNGRLTTSALWVR